MDDAQRHLLSSASNTAEPEPAPVSEPVPLRFQAEPHPEGNIAIHRRSFLDYLQYIQRRCRVLVTVFILYGVLAVLQLYTAFGYFFESIDMQLVHIPFESPYYLTYFMVSILYIVIEFGTHCVYSSGNFRGQPVTSENKFTFRIWRIFVLAPLLIDIVFLGPVFYHIYSDRKSRQNCGNNWLHCSLLLFLLFSFILCRIFSIGLLSLYLDKIREAGGRDARNAQNNGNAGDVRNAQNNELVGDVPNAQNNGPVEDVRNAQNNGNVGVGDVRNAQTNGTVGDVRNAQNNGNAGDVRNAQNHGNAGVGDVRNAQNNGSVVPAGESESTA